MSNHEQAITALAVSDDAKALLFALAQENQTLQQQLEELMQKPLSTNEACKFLGCGRKKFWQLSKADPSFPKPIQFGNTNHYRVSELRQYRDKQ
ncbi:hypothetical protein CWC05_03660 [Pseudoalteromonas ruthenica]|uniref:DNA-binding protein n=1 Tax=Pseudoalteromonas ruthenica TaxID=151081 RepID=A0A5S3Z8G3_9GAMM|nr:hypothetical protein [Pseudoalteromonas ruthenica]TMP88539.1 hypothetical protein CWC05_03660 [Pseudoalteromonas ruthenica]|tara:strand:+ start:54734 stop:55015 length:282 start_codon:yes stop_codon:yes gene_type:complete